MEKIMFKWLSGKQKGDTMNGSRTYAFDDRPGAIRERTHHNR